MDLHWNLVLLRCFRKSLTAALSVIGRDKRWGSRVRRVRERPALCGVILWCWCHFKWHHYPSFGTVL